MGAPIYPYGVKLYKWPHQHEPNEDLVRQEMEAFGFHVYDLQTIPGWFNRAAHTHDQDEIRGAVSGTTTFHFGDVALTIEAGDILIVPAGTVHGVISHHGRPFTAFKGSTSGERHVTEHGAGVQTKTLPTRVRRINHLGIVPKDVVQAKNFFCSILGLEDAFQERVESQKVCVHFIECGPSRLELLEPTTPESPVAEFLKTRGSGIQHVALDVQNIDGLVEKLKAQGVQLINDQPIPGAHHTRIVFVHPRATGGVLVELVEEC